jgi:hypothetical protein
MTIGNSSIYQSSPRKTDMSSLLPSHFKISKQPKRFESLVKQKQTQPKLYKHPNRNKSVESTPFISRAGVQGGTTSLAGMAANPGVNPIDIDSPDKQLGN